MDTTNQEYIEIDLMRLIKAIWKKAWVVALSGILCAAIAFVGASKLITPLYKSSTMFYVNNNSFSVGSTSFSFSASELSAAQSLVETYIVILNTRTTLETVIDRADMDYTYEQLKSMINATAVPGTEVFEVTVTSTSPQEAEKIANTIAKVFPNKLASIIEGSSVRVVDYAVVPMKKASPNITMYTTIGLMMGVAIACGIVILIELMDDQIYDENFLNQSYDIPVLATIPNLNNNHGSSYEKYGGYYGTKK